MVCSIGGGRMATMARLLEAGSVSQTVTEEVGRWTLAAQYIHRELIEADEANLLDEEDMHIFGLKPMTDPLNLVFCNSCKRPVKASQYSDHADRCKLLCCTKEIIPELDGGSGHQKPPRKDRKKSLTCNATPFGELERFGVADGDNISASEIHLGNSTRVDVTLATDGSVVNSGNHEFSAGVMRPPTKRSKLIAAESPLISDDIETAGGITKSLCLSTQEDLTNRGFLHDPKVGSQNTHDDQISGGIYNRCFQTEGPPFIPAPLATKIFYSQRNNRLRLALSQLYYKSSTNHHGEDASGVKIAQGHMMPSWTPMSEKFHLQKEESDKHLSSMENADQILAQSSEVNFDISGACPPTTNFSGPFSVNNALGPHRTPAGMIRSNYLSNPYSLAANSGKEVGRMQQPKGSVPVV